PSRTFARLNLAGCDTHALTVIALTAVAIALVTAVLQGPSAMAADAENGRYAMTPSEGGFLRLDKQTGAVSLCKNTAGKVVCDLAEDSHSKYAAQIESLKKENQKLRAEVDRLEQHFGLSPDNKGKPNDLAPPVPPSSAFKVPREEDVDQMFDYVEGMLKKFRERIRKLEQKPKPETPL
ncbi:MAG: hypothetical protein K0U34_04275, partial [Alphaproteobacteria bacterium]|nr:hypothetical protein [Alphaproteobacteria bacterium]